jgi:hypothetical protein
MAEQPKIKVDLKDVENLGEQFREMAEVGLHRVAERGERLLREEVPKVTHNLEQGVSSDVDASALKAELLVSARAGRVGVEGAELHLPSGATREISLRSQPAYDYARAVAEGTGVYATGGVFGPQPFIKPREAKALLIPVSSVPVAVNGKPQAYITSNGKIYVLRRYSRGRKPDPYHIRAANRLEPEIPEIFDRVVSAFANQEQ